MVLKCFRNWRRYKFNDIQEKPELKLSVEESLYLQSLENECIQLMKDTGDIELVKEYAIRCLHNNSHTNPIMKKVEVIVVRCIKIPHYIKLELRPTPRKEGYE